MKKGTKINALERNVFKLLTGKLSTSEFENYLYGENNINQVDSNKFVSDLIDINYRETDHLDKVRIVAVKHFDEKVFLSIELRFSCLKIIEAKNINDILNIISNYAIMYCEKDYEIRALEHFYNAKNHLNLIADGLEFYSKKEVLDSLKNFARKYLNAFDLKKSDDELLNITDLKSYRELLTYSSEDEIIDYMADRKTDFLSNKKISKQYKSIGFKDSYIKNVIGKIEKSSITKLKTRVFAYTAIGIPFFYVGVKTFETKQKTIIFWFIGFAGLVLLIFSIIYLIQLIVLIKVNKKHSKKKTH